MGAILHIVKPGISSETLAAIDELKRQIEAGAIIGLAFVAMHTPVEFSADSVGKCRECPTLTRGMLLDLMDEISAVARDK